ncbi:MAG: hypothetical protein AAF378_06805 [Cyanobacteria bacterium P01_A01_bin.84]
MNFEAQIKSLINNAPQDGVTPSIVAAIAPVLLAIARSLRYPQYYLLQSIDRNWVMTTLSNRTNRQIEKKVIYAFPNFKDASSDAIQNVDSQVTAIAVPVIHILFQLMALEPVDSIVFFETAGTSTNAVEIKRSELQSLVQQKLQENKNIDSVPPDIA